MIQRSKLNFLFFKTFFRPGSWIWPIVSLRVSKDAHFDFLSELNVELLFLDHKVPPGGLFSGKLAKLVCRA